MLILERVTSGGSCIESYFAQQIISKRYLDQYQSEIGSNYIAIHTRFMNLLGDKTETDINPELDSENQKSALVEAAINSVRKISEQHPNTRILIASDSMVFIEEIKKSKA